MGDQNQRVFRANIAGRELLRKPYETDLSDAEWAIIEPLIPGGKPGGRPRETNIREVINAIFYLLRTGCAWRHLPMIFLPRGRFTITFPRGLAMEPRNTFTTRCGPGRQTSRRCGPCPPSSGSAPGPSAGGCSSRAPALRRRPDPRRAGRALA